MPRRENGDFIGSRERKEGKVGLDCTDIIVAKLLGIRFFLFEKEKGPWCGEGEEKITE